MHDHGQSPRYNKPKGAPSRYSPGVVSATITTAGDMSPDTSSLRGSFLPPAPTVKRSDELYSRRAVTLTRGSSCTSRALLYSPAVGSPPGRSDRDGSELRCLEACGEEDRPQRRAPVRVAEQDSVGASVADRQARYQAGRALGATAPLPVRELDEPGRVSGWVAGFRSGGQWLGQVDAKQFRSWLGERAEDEVGWHERVCETGVVDVVADEAAERIAAGVSD